MGDAAGDVEASQQAAGELLGLEPHELLQADEGDRLGHQAAPLGAVAHVEGAEGVDVLRHRELIEDGDILRHHADATLETVGGGRHRLTEDADRALVVGEQLKDAADRRRLARAVGAEQPQHLTARDRQRQAINRDQLPIALDQGVDLHRQARLVVLVLAVHLGSFLRCLRCAGGPRLMASMVAGRGGAQKCLLS